MQMSSQLTCTRVFVVLVPSVGVLRLFIIIARALVQPSFSAGAAVPELALPAADDGLGAVEALRALKAVSPRALRVMPAVTVLSTRLHVNDGQKCQYHRDGHRESRASPHPVTNSCNENTSGLGQDQLS